MRKINQETMKPGIRIRICAAILFAALAATGSNVTFAAMPSASAKSPVTYDPTSGAVYGPAVLSKLGVKGADIASASSIDLGAATGDFVDVTGTTTITALGTASAGTQRAVRFT